MLLFYINFGDRNPPYPALGSNIPSARRRGQRFHFLQCRGSSPSLCFVNRHGGTLRRAGWVAFTKTYSRGKWLISHLPPTFAIIIHIPRPLRPCVWRPRVPVPHVPASHTWCPQVPRLASPSPRVPTHASRCPRPTFIHSHFVWWKFPSSPGSYPTENRSCRKDLWAAFVVWDVFYFLSFVFISPVVERKLRQGQQNAHSRWRFSFSSTSLMFENDALCSSKAMPTNTGK